MEPRTITSAEERPRWDYAPTGLANVEATRADTVPDSRRFFAFAASRIKELARSATLRSLISRARGPRKALRVRESAALGDRRFISIIQFERQRFLIGSSPGSVTLLARLPDESAPAAESGEAS
jgi:hypothetical protein